MLLEKYTDHINEILSRYPVRRSALLPLLNLAQREDGYVSESAMKEIARILRLTPSQVYEVVTFYTMLNLKPIGKFHIGSRRDWGSGPAKPLRTGCLHSARWSAWPLAGPVR